MPLSGVAAKGAVQLRRAHIDMGAAVLFSFKQKTQQGLPKILGVGAPASTEAALAEVIIRHCFSPSRLRNGKYGGCGSTDIISTGIAERRQNRKSRFRGGLPDQAEGLGVLLPVTTAPLSPSLVARYFLPLASDSLYMYLMLGL
jgi:hypothetical protein